MTASNGRLIRSEEQLSATTRRVVSGVARLEKFVVTEERTITVRLRREEVRLVVVDRESAEPAEPDDTADSRLVGDDASEPEAPRWLTLSEERVEITTRVVPLERVSLRTHLVTEDRQVTESVRVERIELDPRTVRE